MPTYNDAAFRAQFPEFANTTSYQEALISIYFDLAMQFISTTGSPCSALRGTQLQVALNYMTAHLLALGKQAASALPGSVQGGFDTSATIGEISVSKLAPPVKDAWDWWLFQTPYGQALMALLSTLAVGGLSVGGLSEREGFRKIGGVFF
jgi:Protein of unknown function (DUF4054)